MCARGTFYCFLHECVHVGLFIVFCMNVCTWDFLLFSEGSFSLLNGYETRCCLTYIEMKEGIIAHIDVDGKECVVECNTYVSALVSAYLARVHDNGNRLLLCRLVKEDAKKLCELLISCTRVQVLVIRFEVGRQHVVEHAVALKFITCH